MIISMFTINGMLQIGIFFIVLLALVKPLGLYMARVYGGQRVWLEKMMQPVELLIYKMMGIDRGHSMNWREYCLCVLVLSMGGFFLLYVILRTQAWLPFNPQHLENVSPDLAFNTAVSFMTNSGWQSYSGETSLSYFSQMVGVTVQYFLSAAIGMAVLVAFIRGFTAQHAKGVGNFFVDLTRGIIYILLPLSIVFTGALASQGVVQTLSANAHITLLQTINFTDPHLSVQQQTLALGPVASQVAIKQLGTNGGGFFNVNSAHPFENPTPLSNFFELLAIVLIPCALCYTFGSMVADTRQGWALLAAMTLIFIPFLFFGIVQEQQGNPHFNFMESPTDTITIDQSINDQQSGGNMTGKELRFGILNSVLWTSATTAAANGSVNSMIDAYRPLASAMPLVLMKLGEVVYGGVGSGLYNMLVMVLIAVFLCGLIVGRTPEYLGKKIGVFEIKMVSIVMLVPTIAILICVALAVMIDAGVTPTYNKGTQGFMEILYALTSAASNNGSALAGLNGNTPFYNTALGILMLIGRFFVIIPVLAIAGSLAEKKQVPQTPGSLSTHTPIFIVFLMGTVLWVGALNFIPALVFGPVVEHLHISDKHQ